MRFAIVWILELRAHLFIMWWVFFEQNDLFLKWLHFGKQQHCPSLWGCSPCKMARYHHIFRPHFCRYWTNIDVKTIPTHLVNWWFYKTLMIIVIPQLHTQAGNIMESLLINWDWHPKLHGWILCPLWLLPGFLKAVQCLWIVSVVRLGHVNPGDPWIVVGLAWRKRRFFVVQC